MVADYIWGINEADISQIFEITVDTKKLQIRSCLLTVKVSS
jgi:hypothetical protein